MDSGAAALPPTQHPIDLSYPPKYIGHTGRRTIRGGEEYGSRGQAPQDADVAGAPPGTQHSSSPAYHMARSATRHVFRTTRSSLSCVVWKILLTTTMSPRRAQPMSRQQRLPRSRLRVCTVLGRSRRQLRRMPPPLSGEHVLQGERLESAKHECSQGGGGGGVLTLERSTGQLEVHGRPRGRVPICTRG